MAERERILGWLSKSGSHGLYGKPFETEAPNGPEIRGIDLPIRKTAVFCIPPRARQAPQLLLRCSDQRLHNGVEFAPLVVPALS